MNPLSATLQADGRTALTRAYELAYFVLGERDAAFEVAVQSLGKLRLAASAQDRRLSYVPKGRARADQGVLRAFRTRVRHAPAPLLQRLVYVECERFELRQERRGQARPEDLLVRYVKHLVRVTLRRNAFHVTLGLTRLLHDYSTSEALDLHALVMQDATRTPDDDYCRARKKHLLAEMQARFGDALRLVSGARGEQRFATRAPSAVERALLQESLARFTPWDTSCPLPEHFDPHLHELPELAFSGLDPDDEHPVEIHRMHAVLHPACLRRLMRALRRDPPEQRLAVPCFAGADKQTRPPVPGRGPAPPLQAQDYEHAELQWRAGAGTWGRYLSVTVDGQTAGRLSLAGETPLTLALDPEAELVELHDESGRLLAVCLLGGAAHARQELRRADGRAVTFRWSAEGADRRLTVEARGRWSERLGGSARRAFERAAAVPVRRPAPAVAWVALTGLALGLGWLRSQQPVRPPDRAAPAGVSPTPSSSPDLAPAPPERLRGPTPTPETRTLAEARRLWVVSAPGDAPAALLAAAVRRELAGRARFVSTDEARQADVQLRVRTLHGRAELVLIDPAGRELWRRTGGPLSDAAGEARAAVRALEHAALRAASRPGS